MTKQENIARLMSRELERGVDGKMPRIRNLRKIPSEHWGGYSFEFEAFVEGAWREYGPMCQGNWTCLRGLDCLPDDSTVHWNRCHPENPRPNFRTIGIGWYTLDDLYKELNKLDKE